MSTVRLITTRQFSNRHGATQITAVLRSGAHTRQLTVPLDYSARDPHMVAARALANKLGFPSDTVTAAGTLSDRNRIYHLTTV